MAENLQRTLRSATFFFFFFFLSFENFEKEQQAAAAAAAARLRKKRRSTTLSTVTLSTYHFVIIDHHGEGLPTERCKVDCGSDGDGDRKQRRLASQVGPRQTSHQLTSTSQILN